jgi:hypothetical protein
MPVVNLDFLEQFVPYELLLAQRRAMVLGTSQAEQFPNAYIGLYVIRLEALPDFLFPTARDGAGEIGNHMSRLLRDVLRDSDIPAKITDQEYMAVLRDIDPQHAFSVAQRMLTLASSSPVLERANLRTCVGYVTYPLSLQPNFPVDRWNMLYELARRMSRRGDDLTAPCGYGLLRGPQMDESSIPESDLVPLAFQNPDTLVSAGILQIQRIQFLPAPEVASSAT